MKILNPEKDPAQFFESLKKSQSRVLLLDYDGTLSPFSVRRDQAFPYPGVTESLTGIMKKGGTRLVLLTGRPSHDLIPLLGLHSPPEVWGSHGGERLLSDGTYHKRRPPASAVQALQAANAWMAEEGWSDLLEQKPLGCALHWRGKTPEERSRIRRQVFDQLPQLLEGTGLTLHEFDGGVELRSPDITKGHAVEAILDEMPDPSVAAYLGDDLTDEDAFRVIKGRGLAVLVRKELRETQADLWLQPPKELLGFLADWKQAVS